MPDLLDLTDDFKVLDYQETVRFTSVGATDWIDLDTAVGFPLSEREAAASGGVYTQFVRRWDMPDGDLGGIVPKVSDTIRQQSSGTVWTVQAISYSDKTEAWNLDCVNLNLAASLSDTATIMGVMNTQDAALGRIPQRVVKHAAVAARFQEVGQDTRDERGRRIQVTRYQVFVKSPVNVTHEDQVIDGAGNVHEFLSRESADRLDLLTVLNCERKSG